jgi:catechol 2,3-dioxygenase-like lactoylglutathione lyase family enzyme
VTERWRDVAHIGHAELLTPAPEASLDYFTARLGLTVAGEDRGPPRHDRHPAVIAVTTVIPVTTASVVAPVMAVTTVTVVAVEGS